VRQQSDPSSLYLFLFATALFVPCVVVLVLNFLVDPLWYVGGNRLTHKNFVFNERVARLNHFLRSPDKYDCYILGSSRVTLLNETKLTGHTCFNFGFSGGSAREFVELSRYISKRTDRRPSLVVITVDPGNFDVRPRKLELPDHVVADRDPPSLWRAYLSSDVARLSLATLIEYSRVPRYYDGDLIGRVRPSARSMRDGAGRKWPKRFDSDAAEIYAQFRKLFPETKIVGYVPLLSVDFIAHVAKRGLLDDYVRSLHAAATHFDAFYDYSVPSEISADPMRTYDGSHFYPESNDIIAADLSRSRSEVAIPVHEVSLDRYGEMYASRMSQFGIARPRPPHANGPIVQADEAPSAARYDDFMVLQP